MLNETSLIGFVATKCPAESKAFYGSVLGLRQLSEDDYAIVFDANGVMLRVQIVAEHSPQPFTVMGWRVSKLPALAAELVARGVVFERFEGLDQDDSGVWVAPSGARIAWFKDPDGNLLSLTEIS